MKSTDHPKGKRGRPADPARSSAILNAARRLLRQAGPSAVTMERVAQEAGVSKATLYRRYPNRQALLEVLVTLQARRIHRALDRPPQSRSELVTQLETFVMDLAMFLCGAHHRRYVQAMGELPQADVDLALIWNRGPAQTHAALVTYLRAAHAAGFVYCPEPEPAAELLLGMAVGLDLVRALYRMPLARHRLAARRAHATRVLKVFMQCHAAKAACTHGRR
jgi:TetR/AcrR family transcriptional repressor of mexJK operon